MIRRATVEDVDALVRIEERSFDIDRLSKRNFRYLLTKAHCTVMVDEEAGLVRGYAMVLFSAGTSLARLYSFAVDPERRRQGLGDRLLAAAENIALAGEGVSLRAEVRKDNVAAIRLLERRGYRRFGVLVSYYEDYMDALRFAKPLTPHLSLDLVRVPYYQQTLDFTCGPAALMMAMRTLDPDVELNRKVETRIWRESTTIFMTSGHGGCGPYGLALSAYHRGFEVEIYVNADTPMFLDSVRSPEKKEVMRLVQEDFLEEIERSTIRVTYGRLSVGDLERIFREGGIPIVLISSYRIYGEKFPHWVVMTGFDERYIYVHDSYVDYDAQQTVTERVNMPILKKDFERMARYGRAAQKAVVILRKPAPAALDADSGDHRSPARERS